MGGTGVAAHTLVKTKKSNLKRGSTYVFDAMNVLYSMCGVGAISDLLVQKPAVPTREIVCLVCYELLFCSPFVVVAVFSHLRLLLLQVFQYLDRWCAAHNFDGDKKTKPVYLIPVVDGFIDRTKLSRNKTHDLRQRSSLSLKEDLPSTIPTRRISKDLKSSGVKQQGLWL